MASKTILLVEDNRDDADLTLIGLRKCGIEVNVVHLHDGVEAIDYLLGEQPGSGNQPNQLPVLILMDLKLPKLDGLEVLQRLRADELTRSIPVVILSTSKELRDVAEAYRLGANSYVHKSIDFKQFSEAMRLLGLYWLKVSEAPPY